MLVEFVDFSGCHLEVSQAPTDSLDLGNELLEAIWLRILPRRASETPQKALLGANYTFPTVPYFPSFSYCPRLPLLSILSLLSPTYPTFLLFLPFPTVPYFPYFSIPFPTFSHHFLPFSHLSLTFPYFPLLPLLLHTFSYLFVPFPTEKNRKTYKTSRNTYDKYENVMKT